MKRLIPFVAAAALLCLAPTPSFALIDATNSARINLGDADVNARTNAHVGGKHTDSINRQQRNAIKRDMDRDARFQREEERREELRRQADERRARYQDRRDANDGHDNGWHQRVQSREQDWHDNDHDRRAAYREDFKDMRNDHRDAQALERRNEAIDQARDDARHDAIRARAAAKYNQ